MKTSKMTITIVANEILNLLDSTILSSESKNSILVDYLERVRCQGFNEGREALISELMLIRRDEPHRNCFKSNNKRITTYEKY